MKRLLLATLICLPTMAQEAPKPPAAEPAPVMHEVLLRSGTVLVGTIEPRLWKVQTKFGVLNVPVESVKRIRFGRRANPERYALVLELIKQLASANPERRNHAQAGLKQEGTYAAPELRRAAKGHADPEVRRLCQEIFDALELEDEVLAKDDDQVATTIFNVAGSVTLKSFKVTVEELGALNVERKDIVSVSSRNAITLRKFKVTGQNTMVGAWVDTKITIEKGIKLTVKAQGTIHYPRWGNQYMMPDGNPNMGNMNGIWYGALIGKVGAGGPPFRLGANYSGTPKGKGTLFLAVMMNQKGQPSNGEYTVTIEKE